MRADYKVRFWSRVDKSLGVNACWLWTGALTTAGYGHLWIMPPGKALYTHRISWELHYGEIPQGVEICHHCDNPACCNPSHLFLGTHADNMRDARAKNRSKYGVGETSRTHKLSQAQADEIRALYRAGGISQRVLGKRYGVGHDAVGDIVNGRTWNIHFVQTDTPHVEGVMTTSSTPPLNEGQWAIAHVHSHLGDK